MNPLRQHDSMNTVGVCMCVCFFLFYTKQPVQFVDQLNANEFVIPVPGAEWYIIFPSASSFSSVARRRRNLIEYAGLGKDSAYFV